mgnify:CR=1 FL=1
MRGGERREAEKDQGIGADQSLDSLAERPGPRVEQFRLLLPRVRWDCMAAKVSGGRIPVSSAADGRFACRFKLLPHGNYVYLRVKQAG